MLFSDIRLQLLIAVASALQTIKVCFPGRQSRIFLPYLLQTNDTIEHILQKGQFFKVFSISIEEQS